MNYYKKIDGLRFVAIFFVLVEHFASFVAKYISAGYYGVDLFFVISGFLITSILLKQNECSFRSNYLNFLGRRTLRIFPIYYLTLFALWIINIGDVRSYMIYLVTYTANYGMLLGEAPKSPILHFWSLSVEEQFYLFWPFLILFFKKKQMILTFIVIGIIIIGYAQIIFNIFPAVTKYSYWGLFPRMTTLAMGALGAIIYKNNLVDGKLFSSKSIEVCMIFFLIVALLIPFESKTILMGICSLFLVLKSAGVGFKINSINRILINRHIIYIGTISYGIYIFHPLVESLFTKYIYNPLWMRIDFESLGYWKKIQWHSWVIKFPLYSFLSIGLAALSFKYFEKPIIDLKDKLFPNPVKTNK